MTARHAPIASLATNESPAGMDDCASQCQLTVNDDGQRYTSDQTAVCEKLRRSLDRHVRAAKTWIVIELWSVTVVLTFARTYST